MAIHDTFGIAGGATCVTHTCCLIFVDIRRPHCRRRLGKQCLILVDFKTGNCIGHFPLAVIHKDQMLHRGKRREKWLNQREDRRINEDHFIFCMINDVGQLFGKQTNVERVQHATTTGSRKIQLQMALSVPCKRGHTAVLRDSQVVQHSCKTTRALCPLSIGDSFATCSSGSHNVLVAVVFLCTIKEIVHRQLGWLH
ncbi:unannotated protein [freshwater metagenome]|uniref:Unannotated protein n=1 Tax=freshwater metagenome TaxID=449393 RepID=A0A6J6LIT6_9ZZZZ